MENYQAFTTREGNWKEEYALTLTNFEVTLMFRRLITAGSALPPPTTTIFSPALLDGDVEAMNAYMNRITPGNLQLF